MVYKFNNLFGVKEMLKVCLDGERGIRSEDQDRVIVITGDEGLGKSHLLLHIFKIWYDLVGWKIKKDDIKFVADNAERFVLALRDVERFGLVAHDEAIKDLYSRDHAKSFSKDLNKAYAIIRGKNLLTILVIPSILDLETFFRRRRVKGMLHITKKGKLAYFSANKLSKMLPYMVRMAKYSTTPNPMNCKDFFGNKISPVFTDTYPKFEDKKLLNAYLDRKGSNMEGVVSDIYDKYSEEGQAKAKERKINPVHRTIYEDWKVNKQKNKQLGEKYGFTPQYIGTIIRKFELLNYEEENIT